jgi:hypothetical protein
MGKSTISMVILHSYVKLPEGMGSCQKTARAVQNPLLAPDSQGPLGLTLQQKGRKPCTSNKSNNHNKGRKG